VSRIMKVYAGKEDAAAIREAAKVIEKYDAFLLVEADEAEAAALGRRFPYEDITDQYNLKFGDRTIDTSRPRITAAGTNSFTCRLQGHPQSRTGASPLCRAVHWAHQTGLAKPNPGSWCETAAANGQFLVRGLGYAGHAAQDCGHALCAMAGHLPHRERTAPSALGEEPGPYLPRRRERHGVYSVEIFASEDAGRIARGARRLGFQILSQEPKAHLLIVRSTDPERSTQKKIKDLSAVHGVRFIRQRTMPRPANNVATTIMGNAFTARASNGLKLTGEGEII
jgi:serine protease AprX